jgi:tRNA-splicing ligase RtcB
MQEIKLEKLDDNRWLVPQTGAMRVPGIIYASDKTAGLLAKDESARQVANVAHLPGIVNFSLAMPDIHWGYGFPSAAWRLSIWRRASFLPAAWATTSTAAAA